MADPIETPQRLGFIGLGVMGGPMAGHLAAAGYTVTAYDLGSAAMRPMWRA